VILHSSLRPGLSFAGGTHGAAGGGGANSLPAAERVFRRVFALLRIGRGWRRPAEEEVLEDVDGIRYGHRAGVVRIERVEARGAAPVKEVAEDGGRIGDH
jgi:hypothetical protein